MSVVGEGPETLVFGHGIGTDQTIWHELVEELSPLWRVPRYRIVLFDRVGSGGSAQEAFAPERYGELRGYAQDLLEILGELREDLGVGPVRFVGQSISGMMGMLAAIEQPEWFESLVMIGSSPYYLNDGEYRGGFEREDIEELLRVQAEDHYGWAKTLTPLVLSNKDKPLLAKRIEESICRMDPASVRHFARVAYLSDLRGELERLKTPALILQPRESLVAPASVGAYMHKRIAGSELVTLRAEGHCPHVSAPEEVAAHLERFWA